MHSLKVDTTPPNIINNKSSSVGEIKETPQLEITNIADIIKRATEATFIGSEMAS